MTVRQALQELTNAGLVDRHRGKGTFVASRPMHRRAGVFLSFSDEMAWRGKVASSRVVAAGLAPARPEEIDALGLEPDAEVVRVERVRLADGVPIAFEDAAVLAEYRDVLDADLVGGSLHEALERLGVVATSASGTVTARAARRAEAASLDIPTRSALLVELRLLFDQHGRPFERTETRYVADRYVIDVIHFASQPEVAKRARSAASGGTQLAGDRPDKPDRSPGGGLRRSLRPPHPPP